MPKLNVIYVASIGHSGSTLLESMLGAHSQITTCGEIHIWPHELMRKGVLPCACGRSILECDFWTEMRKQINPLTQPQPQIHFFREQHNAGHTLRLNRWKDFQPNHLSVATAKEVKTYGENNDQVFHAFLEVTKAQYGQTFQWIVDASKDPYRLLWLVRSNRFNIKVLHIVKNPRAFVFSMIKRLPNNGFNSLHQRLQTTTKQSLKWSIENSLISQVAQNFLQPSEYMLINYEELASKPQETFQKICHLIGCNFEEEAVNNFRQGSLHTIAGNPMRYKQGGIVLDEKWKTLLPQSSRTVTEIMTSFNRYHFGYK